MLTQKIDVDAKKRKSHGYYVTTSYKDGRAAYEPDFIFEGGLFPGRMV